MNRSNRNLSREIDALVRRDIERQRDHGSTRNSFGHYYEKINGVLVPGVMAADDGLALSPNKFPTEGLNAFLNTFFGARAKDAAFYVALWTNQIAVGAGWTAANFVATAGELTSETEGYTGANRPQWSPNAASGGTIDNVGNESVFNIVATTTVEIEGAALITSQARGSGAGILPSATRYPGTRTLTNGDTYEVGFRNTMTS